MWYCIYSKDNKDCLEQRLTARPEHIKRLQELQNKGRLLLAGPLPAIDNIDPGPNGYLGSLIVAEFESLEEAKIWANNDPYLKSGVYENSEVSPFKKVLP
jgi:uncharacterized protein YciI